MLRIESKLVTISGGILIFGFLGLYSASFSSGSIDLFQRQLIWCSISVVAGLVIYYLPYKIFHTWSYYAYAVGLVLLISVLLVGRKVGGSTSWFFFGGIAFQPSEIMKVATILMLARYVSSPDFSPRIFWKFLLAILIVLAPVSLILLQPDAGTALTYLPFVFPILLLSGLSIYISILVILPFVAALVGFFNIYVATFLIVLVFTPLFLSKKMPTLTILSLVLSFSFCISSNLYTRDILKPHQIKRIKSFLDPSLDAKGVGYNSIQAKVAIGSGGLVGKGYLKGTQTQLKFIPAQSTDFIFCIIAEEFGFLGSFLLILLFFRLIYLMVNLVFRLRNKFARCVTAGIATLLLTHIIINIGMSSGVLPVIGIPLPLVSYGGSFMFATIVSLSIVANFTRNIRLLPLDN